MRIPIPALAVYLGGIVVIVGVAFAKYGAVAYLACAVVR